VNWEEPIFADNVKIKHVMASKLPGNVLGLGKHDVLYEAEDEDGNKARCVFTITVFDSEHEQQGHKRYQPMSKELLSNLRILWNHKCVVGRVIDYTF